MIILIQIKLVMRGIIRMASYQIGVQKKSKISKAIMCFITIFMTVNMMKGE